MLVFRLILKGFNEPPPHTIRLSVDSVVLLVYFSQVRMRTSSLVINDCDFLCHFLKSQQAITSPQNLRRGFRPIERTMFSPPLLRGLWTSFGCGAACHAGRQLLFRAMVVKMAAENGTPFFRFVCVFVYITKSLGLHVMLHVKFHKLSFQTLKCFSMF